ncbi:MAG: nucleotidyltransferase family protein [Oligoflexia bacterium]|nr:nucleotidyltransferase family protein [Oligoflexia bacterium]MBF0364754.1 nucleotidyltransferase family protein [Oligoflexia bacterium]
MDSNHKISNSTLILLAGGHSSRMLVAGNHLHKGLLDYHGHPWIVEQIERFQQCGGKQTIVVVNHLCAPLFIPILTPLADVEWIINATPDLGGPFSSLKLALKQCPTPPLIILPIDTPLLSKEHLLPLLESGPPVVITIPFLPESKKSGHPIIIHHTAFIEKILATPLASSDARLDHQIKKLSPQEILRIAVPDPQILINLNTIEAWNQYCSHFSPPIVL